MPIVFSEGITMRSFPALILQSCQIDPLWPAEEVGAASPNSATPDLDFLFKANRGMIVFKRREIGDPIKTRFAVEGDGLGLFDAGLQSHRVVVKLAG